MNYNGLLALEVSDHTMRNGYLLHVSHARIVG